MFKKLKLKHYVEGREAGKTNTAVYIVLRLREGIKICPKPNCQECKTRLHIIEKISKDFDLIGY